MSSGETAAAPAPDPTGVGPASDTGATSAAVTSVDDLDRLRDVPLVEHPAIFERLHADLQAALADIDGA